MHGHVKNNKNTLIQYDHETSKIIAFSGKRIF